MIVEPNVKAKELLDQAQRKLTRNGLIGMGVAAGAASIFGGLAVAGLAALAAKSKMK